MAKGIRREWDVMDTRREAHRRWGDRITDIAEHERGCRRCRERTPAELQCVVGWELSIRERVAHRRYHDVRRRDARAIALRRLSSRTVGYLDMTLDSGDELRGVVKGVLLGLIAWLILSALRSTDGD